MPPSPPFGTAEEFVDELLGRLEQRGLMLRHADGTIQLTPAAVEKLGFRPGDDISRALGRLSAMVDLEEGWPNVP